MKLGQEISFRNLRASSESQLIERGLPKSAFPETFTYSGWLDIRTRPVKDWKRRFFVLANNFLLSAATPHAPQLERVIPLEGSNVRTKTSDVSFEIVTHKKRYYFRSGTPVECNKWTTYIQKASRLKIKDLYRFLYTLGVSESQNTKVVAAQHRVTGEPSAIKIIDKRTCNGKMLSNEVQILKRIEHESIVRLYDLFETKHYLYLVMEQCEGGELFEQIAALDGGHFTEKVCCQIILQIAQGIKYMHQQGIVHRDLKPENILCMKTNSVDRVKIADFGISKIIKPGGKMKTQCGTLSYTAPEILKNQTYDQRVDFWSIGVIMYILLCGYPPFFGDTDMEVKQAILYEEVELDPEDWQHVGESGKALVRGLLEKDPRKRKTVDDILNHSWKESSRGRVAVQALKKARTSFRQTVLKRRMRKQSMGVFERSSKAMRRIYSSDDQSRGSRHYGYLNHNNKYLNNSLNRHHARSEEDLFELRLPVGARGSLAPSIQELPHNPN